MLSIGTMKIMNILSGI